MNGFLEEFQGGDGGVIFNPETYIADFGLVYRALNRDFWKKKMQKVFRK